MILLIKTVVFPLLLYRDLQKQVGSRAVGEVFFLRNEDHAVDDEAGQDCDDEKPYGPRDQTPATVGS